MAAKSEKKKTRGSTLSIIIAHWKRNGKYA